MSKINFSKINVTMKKKMFDKGDPNRILTLNMRTSVDHDTLLSAVADNLAYNPNNVHHLETLKTTNPAHSIHKYGLRLEFRNVIGNPEPVGDILDVLNMRDWRMVCDRFLCVILELVGKNPEEYDWPTPQVKVTYQGNPDEDDLTISVRLEWDVDEATYLAAKEYLRTYRHKAVIQKAGIAIGNVWILIRRYELEDHSNQTEYCDTWPFLHREDALRKIASTLKTDMRKWGVYTASDFVSSLDEIVKELCRKSVGGICLYQLDDKNNIVYELYRRSVIG